MYADDLESFIFSSSITFELYYILLSHQHFCLSNRHLQLNMSRSGVLIPTLSTRISESAPVLTFPHLSKGHHHLQSSLLDSCLPLCLHIPPIT